MPWVTSATNGNVFEVSDLTLAKQLEDAGHTLSDSDPRVEKPKPRKAS